MATPEKAKRHGNGSIAFPSTAGRVTRADFFRRGIAMRTFIA
ncbi:hypothetical protein [Pseudomonas sp. PIC25]|nr:hypothetical protein [Pseudomonas sp. PIC25]